MPNIYAVGDVIGWPSLASAAYDQGRFAASHFCGDADYRLVHDIPTGIYTKPEISSVGKTERQLTEAKVPYAAGKSMFKSLARAQITGQTVGMLKLLFHRDTRELLGIHCFGDSAAEIVHIGQAIMTQPPPNNRSTTSSTRPSTTPRWPRPTGWRRCGGWIGCSEAVERVCSSEFRVGESDPAAADRCSA